MFLIKPCFPAPGHKVRVSTSGASQLWWTPGSDAVCYRVGGGAAVGDEIVCAPVTKSGSDLEVGEPRHAFQVPSNLRFLDMSHDGKNILASFAAPGSQPITVRVILDWTALLER